jgi:hypothetical protein
MEDLHAMRKHWRFTTFNDLRDTRATEHGMTFDQLVKGFTTSYGKEFTHQKDQLPLWSPTTFTRMRRAGKNAEKIWFLVFDIDDGCTTFDTWRLFHEYNVIAHTSFSNRPHYHKYRIILPLEEPVPAEDWPRASIAAKGVWDCVVGIGEPDSSALNDRARIYFRYGIPTPPSADMKSHHPMFPANYHQTAWNVGRNFVLEYQHIEIKQPVRRQYTAKVYSNGKASINEVMMDPSFRLALANKAGATIQDNEARYISCPQCNRNSVHFSIDPCTGIAYKWPTCNHANSCGWWGRFEDLL